MPRPAPAPYPTEEQLEAARTACPDERRRFVEAENALEDATGPGIRRAGQRIDRAARALLEALAQKGAA